jgi:gliding motility-associated-like protein
MGNLNSSISSMLKSVEQWGSIEWQSMEDAFRNVTNLSVNATDAPDLSAVTSMRFMFAFATNFNDDISDWDVSNVTTMFGLFNAASSFNQDISSWDVSNVTNMTVMFSGAAAFNQPLDAWNVGNVSTMEGMFTNADAFNQDLNSWDVSNVEKFDHMFQNTDLFNGNITSWDVSTGTDFEEMFKGTKAFNQAIGNWNLASATNVRYMFQESEVFNQPLNDWRFPNLTSTEAMFRKSLAFNQDLNDWEMTNITRIDDMFEEAEAFNGSISNWDVSNVTNFDYAFDEAEKFNQDISSWDVSSGENFRNMFDEAISFNQDISSWETGNGTNFFAMFSKASSFNQDISGWDVTSATNMSSMLNNSGISRANYDALLTAWSNQDVNNNISLGATGLKYCAGTAARQSLIDNNNWTIENDSQACSATVTIADVSANEDDGAITVTLTSDAFVVDGFKVDVSTSNGTAEAGTDYTAVTSETITFAGTVGETQSFTITPILDIDEEVDETLTISMDNVVTGANNMVTATDTGTVTIKNDDISAFITTWEINSNQVNRTRTYFRSSSEYTFNYAVDWGDGTVDTNLAGDAEHSYAAQGNYIIKITGDFPKLEFGQSSVASIDQWGDIEWESMENALTGASAFTINASDAPDLSKVTSMKAMFDRTFVGNPDLTSWDVSNITDMSEMFKESDFNGDISGWNVSAVTDMSYMFAQAGNFNTSISNWNTSTVQDMSYMFYYAQSFDQPIDAWDVSSVTSMSSMFADAAVFNQDLNSWDVSSVTKMDKMFDNALLFNGDITGWNVSSVTDMSNMFDDAKAFNQDINGWNVSNVTRMNAMFNDADAFNQDLNSWDVSKVETFQAMFQNNDAFNGDISNWDVSNATRLERMFEDAHAFNQDIGNWQPTNAENLTAMFRDARSFNQDIGSWKFPNADRLNQMFYEAAVFDQDISSWETGNIVDMSSMFENAEAFNQNIGNWDVSSVSSFGSMFRGASVFNQDISEWDMSAATSMNSMFKNATVFNQDISGWVFADGLSSMSSVFENATAFNQDLSTWDITNIESLYAIFNNSGLSVANYDATLIGWATEEVKNDVEFGVTGLQYCAGTAARQSLIDNFNWTIENDSQACSATVTIADVSANEDDGAITVTLTSDAFVVGGFTVDISTSNGTAEAGMDYTAVIAETITFAGTVGETQSFTITPTADSNVESDETLTVSISNLVTDAANTVTITDEATITILNDDNEAPVVTNAIISGIAQVNQTLTGSYTYADPEGDVENGTTFQWYTGTDSPLATIYETVTLEDHEFQAPNAKGGQESFLDILNKKVYSEDFISNTADPISPTVDVVFGVGMGFILYPISTYDSDVYNLNGFGTKNGTKLSLTNLNPTDLSSLSTEADVTNLIESQNLTFTEVRVDLGQEGPNNNGVGAIIAFELVSSRGLTQGLIEIESLDHTNQSVVVNIYIGETSDERITGGLTPITGATSAELELTEDLVGESVIFGITPANVEGTGNETFSEAIGPIQALPQVHFTSTAKSVDESLSTANIEVMLSQAGLVASTVDYTVTGTATGGGVDYTLANGTLSFAAGELSKTIDLTIVDDALIEENETVVITLSNASGADLGTNTVFTYTIVNNDAQVTIEDVSQFEDGESFLITATLEGTIEGGFTVDLSTADGTATVADGDYTAVSGTTLTFNGTDGEVQKLDIAPGVDSKLEADETFTVSLSNLAGTTANVVITDQAVLTIKNDDAAAVTLADASGNEGDGAITVTAILDNAVQGGFTVEVNTADGTATLADSDYSALKGQVLTFAGTAGETQTFTVTPTNDLIIEANETLTVSMSNMSSSLAVDVSDAATVTIVNDDFNNAPTDITISATLIAENNALDAAIGTLTTADADAGNTHTYALVSGAGDTDNASFTIDGSTLKANNTSFNFEDKASYSVRIETNDGEGGTFAKAFEITVTNVNEAPFTLSLTNATIDEADEAQEVGQLMSLDPDNGDTFTYSLVAGDGDADNAQFAISGNTLSTAGAIDFEDGASRSIRVQVADAGGLTFEQTFSITIEDVVAEPVREYTQNQPGADVKNVFSPNGDGVNETWVIEDLLDNPFNQVKIFAQGGKLIYSKVNYSNDWAGTFKDNPVPDGTYYYEILIFENEQSTSPARTIKGFLTIIRNR